MTKNINFELPVFLKLSVVIIGLISFFYILFIGKAIILPLVFGLIIAVLLNPMVNFLASHKFNRVLAIFMAVIATLLAFAGLIYFFGSQATMFQETFPQVKQKLTELSGHTITWVSESFNISEKRINGWLTTSKGEFMNNGGAFIGQAFLSIGGLLAVFLLIPVYIFMFLFYKPLLLDFISRLFDSARHHAVVEVLAETKVLIQSYLVGLLLEAAIVAALNISALAILGIQYAFLLGLLGALLNMIPYVGGLIAIALPILIVLATKPPIYILFVIIAYLFVQFIDNNFIMPKIVGSRVKVNALVSIVAVLIGGTLWGVPGMFLSLPLTAIVKVIFDRVESLKAWGFLLGDNIPQIGGEFFTLRKTRGKPRPKAEPKATE